MRQLLLILGSLAPYYTPEYDTAHVEKAPSVFIAALLDAGADDAVWSIAAFSTSAKAHEWGCASGDEYQVHELVIDVPTYGRSGKVN